MNKGFGEKYPQTTSSIGYPNIGILNFGFLTSQRWRTTMTLYTAHKDIENIFTQITLQMMI
jgi:hypothetical protein